MATEQLQPMGGRKTDAMGNRGGLNDAIAECTEVDRSSPNSSTNLPG